MNVDFIRNGQAFGGVAQALLASGFNTNVLRPYVGDDDQGCYITMQDGVDEHGEPKYKAVLVNNLNATLRKDEWIRLDRAVERAAKPRLKLIGDLIADGLVDRINGMATPILQYQTMGDLTDASMSMDGIRESEYDRPEFALGGLPLPIIHKDFYYTAREIAVSRNGGPPLDTATVALATERCAEAAEKLALGVAASYMFAGYTVYGLTNFPGRNTKTLTLPTAPGWVGATIVGEVLDMIALAEAENYHGPWRLYTSPGWNKYLDGDYSAAKGDHTIRTRLKQVEGVSDIRALDYLPNYQMMLVQMVAGQVQLVIGMDMTTLQWETHGGLRQNFKVMTIMVPKLRTDHDGQSGMVHGVAA